MLIYVLHYKEPSGCEYHYAFLDKESVLDWTAQEVLVRINDGYVDEEDEKELGRMHEDGDIFGICREWQQFFDDREVYDVEHIALKSMCSTEIGANLKTAQAALFEVESLLAGKPGLSSEEQESRRRVDAEARRLLNELQQLVGKLQSQFLDIALGVKL